jgi:hypothetical protein
MRPDLDALLARWQKALRLLDWRIAIEYVRDLCAADGDPVYGLCTPCVDNKTAWIRIRDPETPVDNGRDAVAMVEPVVVHECVHLHFAPWNARSPAEIAAEEQAVWAIAEALVANKDTAEEPAIARAMLAHTRQRTSAADAARRTRKMVDPMVIAALEAANEAEDPKAAIQALLEKIKAMTPAADLPASEPAAGMQAAPPASEDEGKKPPMAARPPAALRAAAAPIALDHASIKRMVADGVAEGVDTFKRDELLDAHGSALSEEDLRWAKTQSSEVVRRMLSAAGQAPTRPGQAPRAARPGAPTRGAATGAAATSLVDRAMRMPAAVGDTVVIDPSTNRISISHQQPIRVQTAEASRT